ncbi:uncharacterized protein LOC130099344 [Rhinichthys klamathensis goyatoka]|uniref:uncharacterized protein LOC130099344 n=1 Tax=Rhinichthys klamathensis goyatoka TaxID=3034132 RepID=UPI0024B500B1|nr:uncharacterized protein LOC130099344 [Rhinichthys klamathensis goyatoka]
MYSIVVFTEKNETEVIPSDWLSIDKKISFWPPYNTTKCRKAVEKNETPDEEWDEYITEWVAEYDSYEKARRKLVKFCKGNSLESTDEDSVRKRVPSSKYVNGFTSDTASGRPPVQASTSWLHTETMERPKKKKFCSNGAKSLTLPAIPPFAPSAPAVTVPEPRQDERELRLYQMLEEIKGQVRQNTLLLQAILRKENAAEVVNEEFHFPIRSMTGIKDLEDSLSNRDTQRSLTRYLTSLGGTSAKDIVHRIMREIMTNELANKFNWQGRGQKSPFSTLLLAKVVIDAAKKQGAKVVEAEEKIKTWLKYSGDRNGGRKKRATEKEKQMPPPQADSSSCESECKCLPMIVFSSSV